MGRDYRAERRGFEACEGKVIKHYLAAVLWSLAMFGVGYAVYKADGVGIEVFFGCILLFLVLGFYDVISRLQAGK